jgi:hypothetical protein
LQYWERKVCSEARESWDFLEKQPGRPAPCCALPLIMISWVPRHKSTTFAKQKKKGFAFFEQASFSLRALAPNIAGLIHTLAS